LIASSEEKNFSVIKINSVAKKCDFCWPFKRLRRIIMKIVSELKLLIYLTIAELILGMRCGSFDLRMQVSSAVKIVTGTSETSGKRP